MAWLFGSKKKEVAKVGKWVEDFSEIDYGYGRTDKEYLGTYHWEGPEPATGRPQNPAETPEGMLRLQQIRDSKVSNKANINARAVRVQQERANKAEEDRVCHEACNAAIAELRARRAKAGGRRKTQKKPKQLQKRRDTSD